LKLISTNKSKTLFIINNHDAAIKKIIEEHVIPKVSSRKKRNYQDAFTQGPAGTAFAQGPAGTAFTQLPPYTRFSDELI
jgi:hypothetical protein